MVRATMSSSGSPFEACEYDHPPSPDRRTWPFGPPMKRMGPRVGPAAIARTIDNAPVLPSTQIPPLLGLRYRPEEVPASNVFESADCSMAKTCDGTMLPADGNQCCPPSTVFQTPPRSV